MTVGIGGDALDPAGGFLQPVAARANRAAIVAMTIQRGDRGASQGAAHAPVIIRPCMCNLLRRRCSLACNIAFTPHQLLNELDPLNAQDGK